MLISKEWTLTKYYVYRVESVCSS